MRLIITAIKIGVAVALINAAAQAALVYWSYYQLKDHAQQTAIFGGRTPPDVLRTAILDKARELRIPVGEDNVYVAREGERTVIHASYEQGIEYFPNRRYPVKFSFEVEGFNVGGGGVPKL